MSTFLYKDKFKEEKMFLIEYNFIDVYGIHPALTDKQELQQQTKKQKPIKQN